ncbi:MAG TPA: holo-ACP synthase [Gemmatimonadales bacterium]|jgi:holo-[acyl-carrier protein] synthase|nr:holo-ACP synthase [Gemmatimonadales bacterium]
MNVIGHGIDLVDIERIRSALERHGERFANRIYTEGEQTQAGDGPLRVQFFAGRFAAKEAVMKALGTGWARGVSWTDIDVRRLASGKPEVVLRGKCKEIADGLGVGGWEISITHTAGQAAASVVAVGLPPA